MQCPIYGFRHSWGSQERIPREWQGSPVYNDQLHILKEKLHLRVYIVPCSRCEADNGMDKHLSQIKQYSEWVAWSVPSNSLSGSQADMEDICVPNDKVLIYLAFGQKVWRPETEMLTLEESLICVIKYRLLD